MPEETVTVNLEKPFAGIEVVLTADPEWRFIESLDSSDARYITFGLAGCIKSWNFKDREGKDLPATAEGIRQLPRRAVLQIINKYGDLYRALPNP